MGLGHLYCHRILWIGLENVAFQMVSNAHSQQTYSHEQQTAESDDYYHA